MRFFPPFQKQVTSSVFNYFGSICRYLGRSGTQVACKWAQNGILSHIRLPFLKLFSLPYYDNNYLANVKSYQNTVFQKSHTRQKPHTRQNILFLKIQPLNLHFPIWNTAKIIFLAAVFKNEDEITICLLWPHSTSQKANIKNASKTC